MRLTLTDLITLLFVSTIAGIEWLRGWEKMGRILFETLAVIGAARLSTILYRLLEDSLPINPAITYLLIFIILSVLGFFLAVAISNLLPISLGGFDPLFAFFFGLVFATAVTHSALRIIIIGFGPESDIFYYIHRSRITLQFLYLGFLRELMAIMVQVRYTIFHF